MTTTARGAEMATVMTMAVCFMAGWSGFTTLKIANRSVGNGGKGIGNE